MSRPDIAAISETTEERESEKRHFLCVSLPFITTLCVCVCVCLPSFRFSIIHLLLFHCSFVKVKSIIKESILSVLPRPPFFSFPSSFSFSTFFKFFFSSVAPLLLSFPSVYVCLFCSARLVSSFVLLTLSFLPIPLSPTPLQNVLYIFIFLAPLYWQLAIYWHSNVKYGRKEKEHLKFIQPLHLLQTSATVFYILLI